jgi:probable HAF family extracellular repeat protein
MWTPDGRLVDLGLLPGRPMAGTSGINEAGVIVGWAGGVENVTERAFVWTESEGMLDLNDLLDGSGAGWTLRSAQAINDSGQILVNGQFGGRFTAALLTPVVPEPGVFGLVGVSALAVGRALGRRSRVNRDSI